MLNEILNLEMIMVILIALGMLLRHIGKITDEGRECLTSIVIDIIVPCNIIISFMGQGGISLLLEFTPIILLAVGAMLIFILLGKLLFSRMKPEAALLAIYGMVNSNSMFIGFPVIMNLLGEKGAMLQSLYMIPVRCFTWSYGQSLFTGKGKSFGDTMKKLLLNPCMMAAMIGVVIMIFEIQLPPTISRSIQYLSDCLMAISMLLIGSVLYGMDVRHIFRFDVWIFVFVRLILAPAAALLLSLLFRSDFMTCSVCVLMAAMPSASITAVFAARYHKDVEYGSLIVAVSTALSIVTIPLWFLVVSMFY